MNYRISTHSILLNLNQSRSYLSLWKSNNEILEHKEKEEKKEKENNSSIVSKSSTLINQDNIFNAILELKSFIEVNFILLTLLSLYVF